MIELAKAFELANAVSTTTAEPTEEKELSPIEKVVATWSKEGQEKWRKDIEEAKHYYDSEDNE